MLFIKFKTNKIYKKRFSMKPKKEILCYLIYPKKDK